MTKFISKVIQDCFVILEIFDHLKWNRSFKIIEIHHGNRRKLCRIMDVLRTICDIYYSTQKIIINPYQIFAIKFENFRKNYIIKADNDDSLSYEKCIQPDTSHYNNLLLSNLISSIICFEVQMIRTPSLLTVIQFFEAYSLTCSAIFF